MEGGKLLPQFEQRTEKPRGGGMGLMRAALLAVALLAPLVVVGPAEATFPGADGKIAMVYGGGECNSVVNPDGSGRTSLTGDSACAVSRPSWAPDGSRIAFERATVNGVWVVNADGSGLTQLNPNGRSPAFSPDGTKIAYWRQPVPAQYEIWTMNSDGTDQKRLVALNPIGVPAVKNLQWSPDGTEIALDDGINIWIMRADGASARKITDNHFFDEGAQSASWAPDGTRLVFEQHYCLSEESCPPDIEVINRDGTGRVKLTTSFDAEDSPSWSPSGDRIAFFKGPDGFLQTDLTLMNTDGSGQTNLGVSGFGPTDWQPLPASTPPPSYEAPKLAAPIRASLVPVFRQCGTGANPTDGGHSPPLGTPACLPPLAQGVAHFGPQAAGTAWVAVIYGDTNALNGDQADATLRFDLSDIRTAGGADYNPNTSGPDGTLVTRLRFTDRSNGPSSTSAGTATDLDFSVPFSCTPTSDPSLGSTCALDSSADAVTPGAITENKATVLQVFRLRLNDSGPNAVRGDSDDRLFAMEGVYIP